ncbi:MAG: hypothetical protein COC17_05115 [Hyphomicrobiales bacterium]|nr:hypothetical protein [Hyphomicrobiales bacterium]PCH50042.1 MAG: hypothetical protein COC17_06565 [Hyphomicrobiales bacterium]PCH50491.1 MAG: hypothetical protein COC17_05115 [Hyphomicrobiales bacterium]
MSNNIFSKKKNSKSLIIASAMAVAVLLSGCTGGTTYGTGVGQEKQTLNDITEMLTFKKKRKVIDYSARPDLIIPNQKLLVAPVDEVATASNSQWPESPEQRIARIRAAAEEAKATNKSRIEFAKSNKQYLSNKQKAYANDAAPIGQGVPNYSCDPDGLVMRQCTSDEISRAVQAQRKQKKEGFLTKRRYLTEPPTAYLKPAGTAVVGDEGFSERELAAIEKQKKLDALEEERRSR